MQLHVLAFSAAAAVVFVMCKHLVTPNSHSASGISRLPAERLATSKDVAQFTLAPLYLTSACPKLAGKDWTTENMRTWWGAHEIEVQSAPDQRFATVEVSAIDGQTVLRHPDCMRMRFDQFLQRATNSSQCCWAIAQVDVEEGLASIPDLRDLPALESYLEGDGGVKVKLWMAQDGKVSSLHFDEYDSIIWQATGSKLIRLVSPNNIAQTTMPIDLLHRLPDGVSWTRTRCPCPGFNLANSENFSPAINLTAPDFTHTCLRWSWLLVTRCSFPRCGSTRL